ncbi:MAG: hypothetical protein ABSE25_03690 [Syntrophorhabdales bacterium]
MQLWRARVRTLCAILLILFLFAQGDAAGPAVILYRIGDGGEEALALLAQSLEGKGYGVNLVQGETDIDKHVEKISRINRVQEAVFLAVEIVPSEKSRVTVAEAEGRKGEGRFLSITEIPSRFAEESDRLAASVAAPFGVKITHLPLFPLLGVTMPGIAVKLELSTGDNSETISRLSSGIEKYFSERTGR